MKTTYKIVFLLFTRLFLLQSCQKDEDDIAAPQALEYVLELYLIDNKRYKSNLQHCFG